MYRRTQIGWVILGSVGAVVLFLAAASERGLREGAWPPLLICLLVLALFCTLTVSVDDEAVEARFGAGLIGKRIPLSEIAACRPVQNQWWYGWGIRWVGTGWMYNVSGLDAAELVMKDG